MKKIIILSLITLCLSMQSFASRAYYTRTYDIGLQFGSHFYGNQVASVMAHIGVQKGNE